MQHGRRWLGLLDCLSKVQSQASFAPQTLILTTKLSAVLSPVSSCPLKASAPVFHQHAHLPFSRCASATVSLSMSILTLLQALSPGDAGWSACPR
jgi:hypothetical protein